MATISQKQTRGVVIGVEELKKLHKFAADAASAFGDGRFARMVGSQQENSARRRIRETKVGPDGKAWKPWSKRYGKTRDMAIPHSLLVGTGKLADTLTHNVLSPLEVEVGSPRVYAGTMLYGHGKIPPRPFLDTKPGFADPHDRAELRAIMRRLWPAPTKGGG